MFDTDPAIEITTVTCVEIRVHKQECIVFQDTWEAAKEVLSVIGDYTNYIDVCKVKAAEMVRAATGCGLSEARLMTEAYFDAWLLGLL